MKPVTLINGDVTVTNKFDDLKIALMNLWKWASNPKIKKFMFDSNLPASKKDFTAFYAGQLKAFYDARQRDVDEGAEYEFDPTPYYAILYQGSNVGFMSLLQGTLVIIIEEAFWRKKIGTVAVKLLSRYAIEEMGYHRVNVLFPSDKVLNNWVAKKFFSFLGFEQDGLIREGLKFDNSFINTCLMSLLETDMIEWETPQIEEPILETDDGIRE